MADQEFLASFGVDIDESGVSRLQKILGENRTLADSLAASFSAAAEGVKAFKASIREDLPSFFPGSGYGNVTENLFGPAGGLKIGLNMTEPKKEISSFTAEAKKPIGLSANASGIVSAARTALENVRSLFSETFILNIRANTSQDYSQYDDSGPGGRNSSASAVPRMSSGGRFSKPSTVEVAEDGDAEYIIPVKKENRALPLLRQLLGELSPAARESLTGGSGGAGIAGTAALSAAMPAGNITQNNNTLSAPVTITVNANSGGAEQIGRTVYDTAERYLLRTLRSAWAD